MLVACESGRGFADDLGQARQHGGIDRLGDGRFPGFGAETAEHELREIQHLDRQTAPDGHLVLVVGGVDAEAVGRDHIDRRIELTRFAGKDMIGHRLEPDVDVEPDLMA